VTSIVSSLEIYSEINHVLQSFPLTSMIFPDSWLAMKFAYMQKETKKAIAKNAMVQSYEALNATKLKNLH